MFNLNLRKKGGLNVLHLSRYFVFPFGKESQVLIWSEEGKMNMKWRRKMLLFFICAEKKKEP